MTKSNRKIIDKYIAGVPSMNLFRSGFKSSIRARVTDMYYETEEDFLCCNVCDEWTESFRAGQKAGMKVKLCTRCGGVGKLFRHSNVMNGVCFKCGGSGIN